MHCVCGTPKCRPRKPSVPRNTVWKSLVCSDWTFRYSVECTGKCREGVSSWNSKRVRARGVKLNMWARAGVSNWNSKRAKAGVSNWNSGPGQEYPAETVSGPEREVSNWNSKQATAGQGCQNGTVDQSEGCQTERVNGPEQGCQTETGVGIVKKLWLAVPQFEQWRG